MKLVKSSNLQSVREGWYFKMYALYCIVVVVSTIVQWCSQMKINCNEPSTCMWTKFQVSFFLCCLILFNYNLLIFYQTFEGIASINYLLLIPPLIHSYSFSFVLVNLWKRVNIQILSRKVSTQPRFEPGW